jgi:transposase-like protein
VIGHGKIGKDKTIQRLKCAACETTFSSRKGTPLYYVKTEPEMIAEVLWWLAEGVDVSVSAAVRYEKTLAQWLTRAGEQPALHGQLSRFELPIRMDELYAKVKDEEKARWLWLAIDP